MQSLRELGDFDRQLAARRGVGAFVAVADAGWAA
jgi:hypothetical protein